MNNKVLQQYSLHAAMGLLMGITLSSIGFADYDELHKMLSLADFRMLASFVIAIMMAATAFKIFARQLPSRAKPFHPGIVPGSILFGIGWVVCGACPAIVFVQLGLGKLPALMTLVGIYIGVKLYRYVHARFLRWDTGSCGV